MLYWYCALIRTCWLVITEENSKFFWSNFRLILLTRQYGGVNSSEASQVCHIMIYGSNHLRKQWQTTQLLFKKKMEKYDDYTMVMVWIMENIVIIPWSCIESWWPCQETWPSSWHDHGKTIAWQPCFSNPDAFRSTASKYFSLIIKCILFSRIVNKCI